MSPSSPLTDVAPVALRITADGTVIDDAHLAVALEHLADHLVGHPPLPQRPGAMTPASLGGIGLLRAAAGLYGTLAFSASCRTREIGIRMALGAGRQRVLSLVVREGALLAGAGVAIGLVAALGTSRVPGFFSLSCLRGACCEPFRAALTGPAPRAGPSAR